MRLNLHVMFPPDQGKAAAYRQHGLGIATFLKPAGTSEPATWRDLEINVRPQGIGVAWDHVRLAPLPRTKLVDHAQRFLANNPMKPGDNPEFLPQEALGIYVHSATAWVRSFTIEAIPDDSHNQGEHP
jgi:hypothetical protein